MHIVGTLVQTHHVFFCNSFTIFWLLALPKNKMSRAGEDFRCPLQWGKAKLSSHDQVGWTTAQQADGGTQGAPQAVGEAALAADLITA